MITNHFVFCYIKTNSQTRRWSRWLTKTVVINYYTHILFIYYLVDFLEMFIDFNFYLAKAKFI